MTKHKSNKILLFIIKANVIHENKYNYSKTSFKTTKDKATIICKNHGAFSQRISSHLLGYGCKKCSDELQLYTLSYFINKANQVHNYKYNYDHTKYKNSHIKVKIMCHIHGSFKQIPTMHLSGRGCPKCKATKIGNLKRKSLIQFVMECNIVHSNFYNYSLVDYKNNHTNIKIICPEHGAFMQKALHHLNGSECPLCSHKNISKMETKWLNHMKVAKCYRSKTIIIDNKKYKVDAYNKKTNTIYEFYGDYWHGNINLPKFAANKVNKVIGDTFGNLYLKTMNRENIFICAGYNIVSIWENDWNIKNKIYLNNT